MDRVDLEDSFLTVAEVAEMLKLNQQTVRNWIDQGSLPALRVGRRVRIRRSDLNRVLADSYSGSAATPAEPSAAAEGFWGGDLIGVAEPAPTPTPAPTPNGVAEPAPMPDGGAAG